MKTSDRPSEPFLPYFAYGANLYRKEMFRLCPNSHYVGFARLNNYSLRIALPQEAPKGPGWATVVPKQGCHVPGGLFLLHPNDLNALDEFEDYPNIYLREEVAIETKDRTQTAMIYRMREPLRPAIPTPAYVETLRRGFGEFRFSEKLLEVALESTPIEGT
jgi:gamma-glutamylcyclotransferase (GGCT)/AIG2-like uncharacterized protein YtfP